MSLAGNSPTPVFSFGVETLLPCLPGVFSSLEERAPHLRTQHDPMRPLQRLSNTIANMDSADDQRKDGANISGLFEN